MSLPVRHGARVRPRELRVLPTVSVVVPVYNYRRFLGACMESILAQDGVDLDVVVVDDASTDGSPELVRQFEADDQRVRGIYHAANKGHIATFNDGIAATHGEYVVLISADDMLTPGALRRAAALLEACPEVSMVYGHPVIFSADPPPARTTIRDWTVWPGLEWIRLRCRRGLNPIRSPEVVMRASALRKAGPYVPELPHACDFAMWMRIATFGDVGRVNGPDQAFYRDHTQNMSKTAYGGVATDVAQRLRAFDYALTPGDGLPRQVAGELRDTAHRKIAREALGHAIDTRYRGGTAEQADEFVALARQAYPAAEELPEWRALRRALATSAPERRPELRLRAAAQGLEWRIRFRRLRRYGI
jgi:Glycosyl transferase family 2